MFLPDAEPDFLTRHYWVCDTPISKTFGKSFEKFRLVSIAQVHLNGSTTYNSNIKEKIVSIIYTLNK